MSIFHFNGEFKGNNNTISLSHGDVANFKKISIMIDDKIVVAEKQVTINIHNGTLIIKTT